MIGSAFNSDFCIGIICATVAVAVINSASDNLTGALCAGVLKGESSVVVDSVGGGFVGNGKGVTVKVDGYGLSFGDNKGFVKSYVLGELKSTAASYACNEIVLCYVEGFGNVLLDREGAEIAYREGDDAGAEAVVAVIGDFGAVVNELADVKSGAYVDGNGINGSAVVLNRYAVL